MLKILLSSSSSSSSSSSLSSDLNLSFLRETKKRKRGKKKEEEEETKRTQRLPRPLHPVPFSLDVEKRTGGSKGTLFHCFLSEIIYAGRSIIRKQFLSFNYSMKARSLYYTFFKFPFFFFFFLFLFFFPFFFFFFFFYLTTRSIPRNRLDRSLIATMKR